VGRAPALLALWAALVIAWYEIAPHLSPLTRWPTVLATSLVVMPAFFAGALIALPLARNRRRLLPLTLAAVGLAVGLSQFNDPVFANLAKFVAVSAVGWLFFTIFEALSWVVAVALVIPWIDSFSVYRGPTKAITTHHPEVFTTLSVALVSPGGGAARIGFPDVMFFAVFLAASVRFELRPRATWICMSAALGLTLILTTVWSTGGGLPALPAVSLGFLLPNADLIWGRVTRRGHPAPSASEG
jgi:hypothetical protein